MATTFSPVTWANGSAPAINASNLQRYETFLDAIADGGSGSVVNSDKVQGKALATPIKVNQGLAGAWKSSIPEYPDNPSGTTYFQDAWATTDSWSVTNGTLSVASGILRNSPTTTQSVIYRQIVTVNGKTWRARARASKPCTITVQHYDGTIKNIASFNVGTEWVLLDCYLASGSTNNYVYYNSGNTLTAGDWVEYDWIYIGDGTYSSKLLDISGNGNHGTVYGATPVDGVNGKALSFDGVNDKTVHPTTNGGPQMTHALWVNRNAIGSDCIVLQHGYYQTSGIYIWVRTTGAIQTTINNSGVADSKSYSYNVPLGTWTHIAIISDGLNEHLYVNGAFVETKTRSYSVDSYSYKVQIGAYESSYFYPGVVSDPRIYNRALSAEEIWELYQAPGRNNLDLVTRAQTPVPNSLVVRDSTGVGDFAGIRFPATQVADSGANVLDDYEEGSFTPSLLFGGASTGITYLLQFGYYTKIGNLVDFYLKIALTNKGSATGNVTISGLPFTARNVSYERAALTFYGSAYTYTGMLVGAVSENVSSVTVIASLTEAGTLTPLTNTNFTNNSDIVVRGSYRV